MRDLLTIRCIRFTPAKAGLIGTGLIGWVALRYGEIVLADISVRQTTDGRRVLSFPETRRRSGRIQQPLRPASQDVRQQIESEVISELRRQGAIR